MDFFFLSGKEYVMKNVQLIYLFQREEKVILPGKVLVSDWEGCEGSPC